MSKQATIKELEWLRTQSEYLSIRKIELHLSMPAGTLHKYLTGARGLDQQWHDVVINWVREFKK